MVLGQWSGCESFLRLMSSRRPVLIFVKNPTIPFNLALALGVHLAILLLVLVLTGQLVWPKAKPPALDPLKIEVIRLAPSTSPSPPAPGPASKAAPPAPTAEDWAAISLAIPALLGMLLGVAVMVVLMIRRRVSGPAA